MLYQRYLWARQRWCKQYSRTHHILQRFSCEETKKEDDKKTTVNALSTNETILDNYAVHANLPSKYSECILEYSSLFSI